MAMRSIVKRKSAVPAAILATAALAVSCGLYLSAAERDARAASRSVSIKDSRFSPRRVDANRNDTVTWRWRSDLEHDVSFTSVPRGASRRGAGVRTGGPPFTKRMTKRGTYRYLCTVHDFAGRVVVH